MEFTTAQLKEFAQSVEVYEKGKSIYENGGVVSLDIDDYSQNDLILVNATVLDEKHYFEVNMSIDKDDYIVKAHLCSCHDEPTIAACPHGVAVLMKVQEQTMKKPAPVQAPVSVKDSWVSNLINKYEHEIVYSTLALNLRQSIHIEPVFEIKHNEIFALTLKIGNDKRYIIKDIRGLLDDIHSDVNRRYGKELSFLHNINSFDGPSKVLISFLEAHINDTFYFANTYRYTHFVESRSLLLMPDALDEFFQMYVSEEMMYRFADKSLTNVIFRDENPPLKLMVSKDEHDVFHLTLNSFDFILMEGKFTIYVLYDRILYRCDERYAKANKELLKAFISKRKPLDVSKNIMPSFYNNVLMSVHDYMPMAGDDISEFAPLPLTCKLFLDMPRINVISARLVYVYGDEEYSAFASDRIDTSRNFNEEIMVRLLLSRYMTRIDSDQGLAYLENSHDLMYEFLHHGVEELNKYCDIYASDKIKHVEIKDHVSISMGVRLESDLLEVSFDTYDFPVSELEYVLKAYRLNKKYYRMKNGSFVNIEDSALKELSQIIDGMHVSEKQLSEGKLLVPKYRSLYLDNSIKDSTMIKTDRDHQFKEIIKGIKNIQDSDFEVPLDQKAVLRNYQKVGYRWLKTMAAYGFGGILADDMGIGKTLQVITLLEDEKIHHPDSISLVICPSSLLLNWQSEIEKFSKHLTSLIIHGSSEERAVLIRQVHDYDIIITSYDYLKRDVERYQDIVFTYQIIDEAQYIKNHNTKNAQCVKLINSAHKFALTGTPIENSLAELWSIFDFLMPGYLFTYTYFKKEYEQPIVKDHDMQTLAALKRLVEPFILRRIKRDVLKELPEKVETTMFVDLNEEARKLYSANVALAKQDIQEIKDSSFQSNKMIILTMLTRLRQLCCDPRLIYENYHHGSAKLDACMELVNNCRESGKKVLIFSQFTSLLALIEEELKKEEIPYYLLKGSTPKIQRQHLVNAFNSNDVPVFLISLKAGGTGLNLTSAEVVIHYDPWWNISAQNQATDRAYRIGQHNNVQVFRLIAKDTIEEKILNLQNMKQDLSDSIIYENGGVITQMSKDDILDLF